MEKKYFSGQIANKKYKLKMNSGIFLGKMREIHYLCGHK